VSGTNGYTRKTIYFTDISLANAFKYIENKGYLIRWSDKVVLHLHPKN
jgi:hypothetical protein